MVFVAIVSLEDNIVTRAVSRLVPELVYVGLEIATLSTPRVNISIITWKLLVMVVKITESLING